MIDVVQWRACIGTWNGTWNKCICLCRSLSRQLSSTDVIGSKLLTNNNFIIIVLSVLMLVCGDIEVNPGPLTDKPPLLDVHHYLKEVSCRWDDIGRELGVARNFREGLQKDTSKTEDKKLEDILYEWIQSECSIVSWEALIKVLTEQLRLVSIANKIEHTEGNSVHHNQGDHSEEESSSDSFEDRDIDTRFENDRVALDAINELKSCFENLLSLFRQEMANTDETNDKVKLAQLRTLIFNALSPNNNIPHVKNIIRQVEDKNNTCGKMFELLVKHGLIGYLNYELLTRMKVAVPSNNWDSLNEKIKEYEKLFRSVLKDRTDFHTLMMIFREYPDLKPVQFDVGLPRFKAKLVINERFKLWNWKKLLKRRFSWSDHVKLCDITLHCIVLHLLVLPIAARAVVRDLTDKQIRMELEGKGIIDITLSDELLFIGRLDAGIATIDINSLVSHFNQFITDIEKELADSTVLPTDIVICFRNLFLSSVLSDIVQHHVQEIEKAATAQCMWKYLVDSHFVQYLNINLVGQILPKTGGITKLIKEYEDHQRKILDQTDFIILLEILSTHSEYSPGTISGLPKFALKLEDPYTSISIFRLNQIFLDNFKSYQFFVLTNINKSEHDINIDFSVLPFGVSDTIKELDDVNRLKYIGVTILDTSDLVEFEISCKQTSQRNMAAKHENEKQKFGTEQTEFEQEIKFVFHVPRSWPRDESNAIVLNQYNYDPKPSSIRPYIKQDLMLRHDPSLLFSSTTKYSYTYINSGDSLNSNMSFQYDPCYEEERQEERQQSVFYLREFYNSDA